MASAQNMPPDRRQLLKTPSGQPVAGVVPHSIRRGSFAKTSVDLRQDRTPAQRNHGPGRQVPRLGTLSLAADEREFLSRRL